MAGSQLPVSGTGESRPARDTERAGGYRGDPGGRGESVSVVTGQLSEHCTALQSGSVLLFHFPPPPSTSVPSNKQVRGGTGGSTASC